MAKVAKTVDQTAPAAPAAATYALSEKALTVLSADRLTRQRDAQVVTPKAVGHWAKVNGATRPNTRAAALSAIEAAAPCTLAAARSALADLHKAGTLGSGTPASYVAAFVKNGYLVEAK